MDVFIKAKHKCLRWAWLSHSLSKYVSQLFRMRLERYLVHTKPVEEIVETGDRNPLSVTEIK
jgi:hypothetical protein